MHNMLKIIQMEEIMKQHYITKDPKSDNYLISVKMPYKIIYSLNLSEVNKILMKGEIKMLDDNEMFLTKKQMNRIKMFLPEVLL